MVKMVMMVKMRRRMTMNMMVKMMMIDDDRWSKIHTTQSKSGLG